ISYLNEFLRVFSSGISAAPRRTHRFIPPRVRRFRLVHLHRRHGRPWLEEDRFWLGILRRIVFDRGRKPGNDNDARHGPGAALGRYIQSFWLNSYPAWRRMELAGLPIARRFPAARWSGARCDRSPNAQTAAE